MSEGPEQEAFRGDACGKQVDEHTVRLICDKEAALPPLGKLAQLRILSVAGVPDLERLRGAPQLEQLTLRDIQNIDALSSLPRLRKLTLISGDFSDLPALPTLEHLVVAREVALDLKILRKLPALKSLAWSWRPKRPVDASALAQNASLEELDFSGTRLSDLAPLASLERLRKLKLRVGYDDDVSPLHRMRALAEGGVQIDDLRLLGKLSGLPAGVTVGFAPGRGQRKHAFGRGPSPATLAIFDDTEVDWGGLSHLTGLRTLELETAVTGALRFPPSLETLTIKEATSKQLAALGSTPRLRELRHVYSYIHEKGGRISDIPQLPQLEFFHVTGGIGPLDGIERHPKLRKLWISGDLVSRDIDLRPLAKARLHELGLFFSNFTGEAVLPSLGLKRLQVLNDTMPKAFLAEVPNLEGLFVQYVDASQVALLAGLTELRDLEAIGDFEDIRFAKNLTKLTKLKLYGVGGSLEPLSGLTRLEELDLSGPQLTSDPVSLRPLMGLKRLKRLALAFDRVDFESVEAFRQAVPNCRIEWSG